jgi:hypothetical protein
MIKIKKDLMLKLLQNTSKKIQNKDNLLTFKLCKQPRQDIRLKNLHESKKKLTNRK